MSIAIFNYGKSGMSGINITAYSAIGNLPASDDEGAVAVITSIALGNVYISVDEPDSPASGDVWMQLGVLSGAPIDLTDKLTIHPRGVYQYDGSAWDLLDSYVWHSSAWVQLLLLLYDSGTFYLGNNFGDTSGYHRSSWRLENTRMVSTVFGDVNGGGYQWAFSTVAIDLTNISVLRITYSMGGIGTASAKRIGVATARGTAFDFSVALGSSPTDLDVSALSGLYYIGTYFECGTDSATVYGYVTKIELL